MKIDSCNSKFALRNLMIVALITVSVPLIISACHTQDTKTPERTTEFVTAHLDLSDEQTSKFSPIAENMFAEKEDLLEMRKKYIIDRIEKNTNKWRRGRDSNPRYA